MVVDKFWARVFVITFTILTFIAVVALGRATVNVAINDATITSANKGDHVTAYVWEQMLAIGTGHNFIEPYKAPYNAGTAAAHLKEWELAVSLLEDALHKVDYEPNECLIRNNLAYVYTQLAEEAIMFESESSAKAALDKVIELAETAPPSCFPPPPDGNASNDDEMSDAQQQAGEDLQEQGQNAADKQDELGEGGDTAEEQIQAEMERSKTDYEKNKDESDQSNNPDDEKVSRPW